MSTARTSPSAWKSTPDAGDRFTLVWTYDDNESAVRAERDRDGDGRVDVWYTYRQNRLAQVAEDTDGNGQADLWED